MPHGSVSLGEASLEFHMLRLACDACGRRGQYCIDKLLEPCALSSGLHYRFRAPIAPCPEAPKGSNPELAASSRVRLSEQFSDLSEGLMSAVYPLDLQREINRRWAHRLTTVEPPALADRPKHEYAAAR